MTNPGYFIFHEKNVHFIYQYCFYPREEKYFVGSVIKDDGNINDQK